MPSSDPTLTAQDFVPFATAALDFHRALNLPASPLVTSRAELDSLHEHMIALYELLDAHAMRTGTLDRIEADSLQAACTRIWQATDHLHTAYHAAPRPDTGQARGRETHRAGLPEGAPQLTICRRHQAAVRLVRRRSTPADLRAPFTGLIRH